MGLHMVLYPWLVVGILQESPGKLGLAQMAVLLPNLLFILPGGVASDRRHRGSWLSRLYLLYLFPIAILMGSAVTGELSFSLILMFGMMFGSITAFVQPARESLLGFTPAGVMHQAVAKVTVVQFLAQSAGFMVAGQLTKTGLVPLFIGQIVLFLASFFLIRRSHPEISGAVDRRPVSEMPGETWKDTGDGLKLFWSDRRLLHLLILVTATGFLAFGVYLVGMPLLVLEGYQGGASLFAALQLIFTLGIVSSNVQMMKRDKLFRRPGRLIISSLLLRGGLLAMIALLPPLWLLFPLVYVWGFLSGISMNLGRTILHNQVEQSYRARAASVYQLCLFGSTPLGAWLSGVVIGQVGLSQALIGFAAITVLFSLLIALVSPLWRVRSEAEISI